MIRTRLYFVRAVTHARQNYTAPKPNIVDHFLSLTKANAYEENAKLYNDVKKSNEQLSQEEFNTIIATETNNQKLITLWENSVQFNLTPTTVALQKLSFASSKLCDARTASEIFFRAKSKQWVLTQAICQNLLLSTAAKDDMGATDSILQYMIANTWIPNTYTFSVLIKCYIRNNKLHDTKNILDVMLAHSVSFNSYIVSDLLIACNNTGSVKLADQVLEATERAGYTLTASNINCLIQVFASHKQVEKAFDQLKLAKTLKHALNEYSVTALLRVCETAKQGKEVIEQFGVVPTHNSTLSALIRFYLRTNQFDEAIEVANKQSVKNRSIQSFSHIIKYYLESKDLPSTMRVFQKMIDLKIPLDNIIFTQILRGCASSCDLPSGLQVYEHLNSTGVKPDTHTYTALIDLFVSCNEIDRALSLLQEMKNPNHHTYSILVSRCASLGAFVQGKKVVEHMQQRGLEHNLQTFTALLDLYVKERRLDLAKELYSQLHARIEPDIVLYNTLFAGCKDTSDDLFAEQLYVDLLDSGLTPTIETYFNLMALYLNKNDLKKAIHIFDTAIENKISPITSMCIQLLQYCAKTGSISQGSHVITQVSNMKKPDVHICSAVLSFYVKTDQLETAIEQYNKWRQNQVLLDQYAYTAVISGCINAKQLYIGENIVKDMFKDRIYLDLVGYTAIIRLFISQGNMTAVMETYKRMQSESVKPDDHLFSILLTACADNRCIEDGFYIFNQIKELNNDTVINSAINMFSKLAYLEKAQGIFNAVNKSEVTWTTMINGYGINGHGEKAVETFYEMIECGIQPSRISVLVTLSACSHAHHVEKALQIYNSFIEYHGDLAIENAMVDTFARAGQVDEAINYAKSMKDANIITWMQILGACRTQRKIVKGVYAAEQILSIDSKHVATYVVLANMYAEANMYDKATSVRQKIVELGLKKEPGVTSIEYEGKHYKFFAQGCPLDLEQDVVEAREEFFRKLKDNGYVVDTSVVTDDMDENTKQAIACQHSEKSALIFLLKKTSGTVRMYKNLRICVDCHNATAIASSVYNRKIIMQDRRRTHVFKNGKCSCDNKW